MDTIVCRKQGDTHTQRQPQLHTATTMAIRRGCVCPVSRGNYKLQCFNLKLIRAGARERVPRVPLSDTDNNLFSKFIELATKILKNTNQQAIRSRRVDPAGQAKLSCRVAP